MQPRLPKEDYCILAHMLVTSRELQNDMFDMVRGKFPKNSKAIRKLIKMESAISAAYYQLETEFFRDYPEEEEPDYGEFY